MSKTPRTDKKEFKLYDESLSRPCSVVRSSFARQLENELAEAEKKVFAYKTALELAESELIEARAEIERKDALIEQMREEISRLKRCCNCEYANHKLEVCEHADNEPETFMDGVCDLWSHNI